MKEDLMIKILSFLLSLLVLSSCTPVQLNIKKYELKNGLKVLIYEDHRLPILSYVTFFDVGGKHEIDGITGSTHFLEHMMFMGRKKYGGNTFDTFISSIGGKSNAYTSFDSTVYYESIPSSGLKDLIKYEADRMSSLTINPTQFISEKDVILEERRYRYENKPEGKLFLSIMQAIFKGTPYGGSVIGKKEDVRSLTAEILKKFFNIYYVPNNAIIVIAGDVDAEQTLGWIKDKFEKIPRGKHLEALKKKESDPKRFLNKLKYGQVIKIHSSNSVPMFAMAYKADPLGTRNSFIVDLLSGILSEGKSSALSQKYVQSKKPLLRTIDTFNYNLKHSGIFVIEGNLLESTNLEQFRKRLISDSLHFCDKNIINKRSLEKVRNQQLTSFFSSLETNASITLFIGNREHFYGDYSYYLKELEIYDSITVEEITESCHKIFDKKEQIFISLWNKHKKK